MLRSTRWQDLVLPILLIASVLVIIIPLPTEMLDLLLAANITVSVTLPTTTAVEWTPKGNTLTVKRADASRLAAAIVAQLS